MTAAAFERLSLQSIRDALSFIPASDREVWVKMAMAVKSELGADGFELWDSWSATDPSYDKTGARDVWRSAKPHGGVTIASLMRLAIDNGYRPGTAHRITDAEYAERQRVRAAEEEAEAARIARRQARAAEDAREQWDAADPAGVDQHPYILRKGIPAHAMGQVRLGVYRRWQPEGTASIPGALLIPIYGPDRATQSLQAIFPDDTNALGRDRDYLPGGRKAGGYFPIGRISHETAIVLVCEGYATGAALHAATGHPVLVAFDAGNLVHVARMARERLPSATLVICGDNDHLSEKGNTGVRKATQAAAVTGALVAIPEFPPGDTGNDFDDLARSAGPQAVVDQLERVIRPRAEIVPAPANDNAPMTRFDLAAVDWFTPLPDTNAEGKKPVSTIQNLEEICRRLSVTIRYNVISKDHEILIPGEAFSVDNQANASLAWMMSACARFRMPTGQLGDFITYIGDRNPHNPVANWIRSSPWDGKPRLRQLFDTITTEGERDGQPGAFELKAALIGRWMLSAVAAAFNPNGVSAHGVLVLQGDQYLGKTKWFKSLVPEELNVIRDGLSLRPDDRDSVFQAVSHWLVELGELDATFRKADISALKAFLTRDKDILRRAYSRLESKFARRTVFFASVNPRQFLHDSTGNRRYWTLPCVAIDHSHDIDMQQAWAEVYEAHFLRGESWYLTVAELDALNDHNAGFEVLDPVRERAQQRYDWDAPELQWRWLTATEVMLELGFDRPTRGDVTQAGQVIRDLNGKQHRRSNGRALVRVPPKKGHTAVF